MLTPKFIKLFNVIKLTRSNQSRAYLPDVAISLRPLFVVHRSLELICVIVVCLASLFLNVRPQAKVEGVQIW